MLLANPDVELIMQKDAEGNGFCPLSGIDFEVVYVPGEDSWYGECYDKDWTADECCLDEDEWEELKRTNSGYAILFPVN